MENLKQSIEQLLVKNNTILVAHYYVDKLIQELADKTGGIVADSLEMARFGRNVSAKTLVVAGVRFMGETAKILSPDKRVLVLDSNAACSLDLDCPIDQFSKFCDQHPDRTIVVYANTSATVKARADWVVTSAIALDIIRHLDSKGEKILWAPDKHLGNYIQEQTGADMIMWNSSCIVHDEFKGDELSIMRDLHPQAKVLVHPESPQSVIAQADIVGSTTQLINAVKELSAKEFIVATEKGVFHKMRLAAPDKKLIIAPTAGKSASCKSCALCPWMAMNNLEKLETTLLYGANEIKVDTTVAKRAVIAINRMLDFSEQHAINVKASGNLTNDKLLFNKVGAV